MTSKDDRKATRLPLTLTFQSYLLCALPFSTPTDAPRRLVCSRCRQPQDCVCPLVNKFVTTIALLPQSHWQRQQERPTIFDCASSYSSATSRPKRCPVKSSLRLTPCLQPQDGLAPARLFDGLVTNLPQSHRHNHMSWCLQATRSSTVRLPNRLPTKSIVPNISRRRSMLRSIVERTICAFRHPQDTARPFFRSFDGTTFSVPQVQRHSQYAPLVVVCENDSTVNCPKTLPVKSLTLPIAPSNNNAPHACPVKLPRRHIKHERRSYQYSTRAYRLGNYKYSTEGAI